MRGLLASLLILVLLAPPAAAATGKLGLQVGIVNNELTGQLPPEGKWEGQSTFGATAIFELDLSPDVSLSLQPGFTPRDSRQVFKYQGQKIGSVDYALNYVTVPFLVRVTGDPLGVRGFVTAGVELGILLDATVSADGDADFLDEIAVGAVGESLDLTDGFQSTTLGALFGAGVMVPLGRQFLTFELRYVQGVTDIVQRDNTDEIPGITGPSVKYQGFELMAGYLFPLGRR